MKIAKSSNFKHQNETMSSKEESLKDLDVISQESNESFEKSVENMAKLKTEELNSSDSKSLVKISSVDENTFRKKLASVWNVIKIVVYFQKLKKKAVLIKYDIANKFYQKNYLKIYNNYIDKISEKIQTDLQQLTFTKRLTTLNNNTTLEQKTLKIYLDTSLVILKKLEEMFITLDFKNILFMFLCIITRLHD